MRGFRLFPQKTTSVAVEWRIGGFRVRTFHALFVFIGGFVGASLFVVSVWPALVVLATVGLIALGFAAYVYRNDPELVLGEMTLATLLWKGAKQRYSNNETQED